MPPTPPSFGISRYTALVLGLVVVVCIGGIGGASYLKYRLDRAESTVAAPDNAIGGDQDIFSQLREAWGFSGFLGLAQKYAFTHDISGITEMKNRIQSADEIVASLPQRFSAQTRSELTSIAALFDDASQKINLPASRELSNEFSVNDLAPLYAALSTLDARMSSDSAAARLAAQQNAQFWAMLLTLVSWSSLILAAACASGIWLVLRDKQSAPMRALAQSIQNMARGDMRTSIWGIERQDMIGDLARAVDLARYHFSHLPDVSLMSEEGPVRLRFEGGSRSLFDAMMKSLSGNSENIREQTSSLTTTINQQKGSISDLSAKVETILQNIMKNGQSGEKQIILAVQEMVEGAEFLKNAHAHTADQLTRLIPVIQDRAQGLTEITQITGKQLAHTLQSLAASEMTLKANSETAKETLGKLSSTAGDLGERLFGAINLLQASGKVLGETTQNIRSQWNNMAPTQEWGTRLEEIQRQLGELQTKLAAQMDAQLGMAKALEQNAEATNSADALAPMASQIEQMMGQLTSLKTKLDEQPSAAQAAAPIGDSSAIAQKISELVELEGRVAVFISALPGDLRQALRDELQGRGEQGNVAEALQKEIAVKLAGIETCLAATQRAAEATQAEVSKPACEEAPSLPEEIKKQFLDQWFQMSAQIEASRTSMVDSITAKINELESRLAMEQSKSPSNTATDYSLKTQIEKQTEILAELVNTLGLLDAHVQQVKTKMIG